MVVSKDRGATKKLGPIGNRMGRKVVRFKVKNLERHYTVHEDLLCSSSAFFKGRLQNNRKDVQGDCVICHEKLDPSISDITFCKAECGQNVHQHCYERWSRTQATCPSCRTVWTDEQERLISMDATLDREALDLYLKWLHCDGELDMSCILPNPRRTGAASSGYARLLLRHHTVGVTMQDKNFTRAIVCVILGEWKLVGGLAFGNAVAKACCADESIAVESINLLAQCYLSIVSEDWFTKSGRTHVYPSKFRDALATMCLKRMGSRPSIDEALAEHLA